MLSLSVILLTIGVHVTGVTPSTIIDLSHDLSESTLYWPGIPHFNRTLLFRGTNAAGIWLEVGSFSTGEHGGTHLDAPSHFSQGGFDLSQIPLELAVSPGVHIDVTAEVEKNSTYMLSLDRVKQWESDHGPIPPKAAVLVNFGWSVRWPDINAYFNTEDTADPHQFAFPSVSAEVSEYLLDQRDVHALAVDTASSDNPLDDTFPNHVTVLTRNRLLLENLKIPSSLPPRGFTVHAAPLKMVDGTGVQTRIYAILDSWHSNAATNFRWLAGPSSRITFSAVIMVVHWIVVALFCKM